MTQAVVLAEHYRELARTSALGKLFRDCWVPVASVAMLEARPVRRMRIVGEEVLVYRDLSGDFGVVGAYCPHRRIDMRFAMAEAHGVRCPFHGWYFDGEGRLIEAPLEPRDSPVWRETAIPAYPTRQAGGLVFAYFGSAMAPRRLLPAILDGGRADAIGTAVLDRPWWHCQVAALHSAQRATGAANDAADLAPEVTFSSPHGITIAGIDDEADSLSFRVPIDEGHTWCVYWLRDAEAPRTTEVLGTIIAFAPSFDGVAPEVPELSSRLGRALRRCAASDADAQVDAVGERSPEHDRALAELLIGG